MSFTFRTIPHNTVAVHRSTQSNSSYATLSFVQCRYTCKCWATQTNCRDCWLALCVNNKQHRQIESPSLLEFCNYIAFTSVVGTSNSLLQITQTNCSHFVVTLRFIYNDIFYLGLLFSFVWRTFDYHIVLLLFTGKDDILFRRLWVFGWIFFVLATL